MPALQDEPGRGPAGRVVDVPAPCRGHRERAGVLPSLRARAGAGHRVTGLDLPGRGQHASISSRASAPTARRASPSGRCARTATTTRSTAASSSWRPTTGTTSRARIRARAGSGCYVYDDYARALDTAALGQISGRLVAEERYDPATQKTTELRVFRCASRRTAPTWRPIPATAHGRRASPPR